MHTVHLHWKGEDQAPNEPCFVVISTGAQGIACVSHQWSQIACFLSRSQSIPQILVANCNIRGIEWGATGRLDLSSVLCMISQSSSLPDSNERSHLLRSLGKPHLSCFSAALRGLNRNEISFGAAQKSRRSSFMYPISGARHLSQLPVVLSHIVLRISKSFFLTDLLFSADT